MDQQRLIKRLRETFLGELEEHVSSLNRELLELEKGSPGSARGERVQSLFRTAHSLKGAARAVNIDLIQDVCHELEDILGAAREGRRSLGPAEFRLLFAAADALEDAGERLRQEQSLDDSPLADLLVEVGMAALEAPAPAQRETLMSPPVSAATSMAPPPSKPEPAPLPPVEALAPLPSVAQPPTPTPSTSVRVAADRLDDLLTRSGELLVTRRQGETVAGELAALRDIVGRWRNQGRGGRAAVKAGGKSRMRRAWEVGKIESPRKVEGAPPSADDLRQLERELDRLGQVLMGNRRSMERAALALDEEVRRTRLLPFAEVCQGLDRLVRDVAQAVQKNVELNVQGDDVELDRAVLEALKDPLRHLLRNAIDHGIESADVRRGAGKSPQGQLSITATLRGAHVEVAVADDGRGLDLAAVRRRAQHLGLPVPSDENDLAELIFLPGFSTAQTVTELSGRGVGLDVVKGRLEGLHGTATVQTERGRGTRFTLAVPLTLTTMRVLLVKAAGQTLGLPNVNIRRLVRLDPSTFRRVEGRCLSVLDGEPVLVASLAATLGLIPPQAITTRVPAVVVAGGAQRVAFVVDELLSEQEVMIKSMGNRVRQMRHISGATLLPTGAVAFVLNAADLARTALMARGTGAGDGRSAASAKKRIVIAEDSVTTRTLQKTILEAAGYAVETAADGARAWDLLREGGADLLLSDVDMPLMDGFTLTETVRNDPRFARLPVVLMTSRGSEQDRARGVAVGADAYLVKSGFNQSELLETLSQLL